MKTALTYDDIQLVPAYSNIESRTSISLETKLSRNLTLNIPFVASPMDTVCEEEMAYKLFTMGGVGCIHRFMAPHIQTNIVSNLVHRIYDKDAYLDFGWKENQRVPIMAAIGVDASQDRHRATLLVKAGINSVIIDVAHGHHSKVIDMIKWLKDQYGETVDVIAGNIATAEAAETLQEWGADALRVGIGGGSLCTTRIKTGFGIPNVTCIEEIVKVAKIPVMADGGIRTSGDIAKALAVGADTVMLGSLIAGTEEAPGQMIEKPNGLYKRYRGSASLETKNAHGQAARNVEGESTIIPYKGGVKFIVTGLLDGVKSALSYAGANRLDEFHPDYVVVTSSGINEARPHLIY